MKIGALLTLLPLSLVIYGPNFSLTTACILLFLAGAFCCFYQLPFAYVSERVPESGQGVAMGLTNMLSMSTALVFQPIIGLILSATQNSVFDGAELYTIGQYQQSLTVVPLGVFIGFLCVYFLPEKK